MNRSKRFTYALGCSVCSGVVCYTLLGALVKLLIRRAGDIAAGFIDSDMLESALGQLEYAKIVVPIWLPVLCGAAVSAIIWYVFSTCRKTGIKICAVILAVVLLLSCVAGTFLLAKVNTVPVHSFLRILTGYLGGGGLDGVL